MCWKAQKLMHEYSIEHRVVIGFEPFWAQCAYTLKQVLCAPYYDLKS